RTPAAHRMALASPVATKRWAIADRACRRNYRARDCARLISGRQHISRGAASGTRAACWLGRAGPRIPDALVEPRLSSRERHAVVLGGSQVASVGVDDWRRHLRSLRVIRTKRSSFG